MRRRPSRSPRWSASPQRARLAGAGIAGTLRLAYTPAASFETLGAILAAVEDDRLNMTVALSEVCAAEVPGRVLAGKVDVGVALDPQPTRGVRSERLRVEPLVMLVGERHRLADPSIVPLAGLATETLLLFPRELAPAHYDRIVAACEQAGFEPRVTAFPDPPPPASSASSLARSLSQESLRNGRCCGPRAPNPQQSHGSSKARDDAPTRTTGCARRQKRAASKSTQRVHAL